MSAYGGEVSNKSVGLLAHDAAFMKIFEDSIQQVWVLKQRERLAALLFGDFNFRLRRFERFFNCVLLKLLKLAQHAAHVLVDRLFICAGLGRASPLPPCDFSPAADSPACDWRSRF
jgi:hypothetical protein